MILWTIQLSLALIAACVGNMLGWTVVHYLGVAWFVVCLFGVLMPESNWWRWPLAVLVHKVSPRLAVRILMEE